MNSMDNIPIEYKFVHGRTCMNMTPSSDLDRTFFFCIAVTVHSHCSYFRINDETILLREGETIVIRERVKHDIWTQDKTANHTFSYFNCRFASLDVLQCMKKQYIVLRDERLPEILKRINASAAVNSIYGKICCDMAMAQLVSIVLEASGSTQENPYMEKWLADVIAYINKNLSRQIFSDELIAISGYAKTAFYSRFMSIMKMSPNEYILSQKMQAACAYLVGGMSVSETAEKVGFNDKMYFSKVFKSYMGVAPSLYQKECVLE